MSTEKRYMSQAQDTKKFALRDIPSLVKKTYTHWIGNNPFQLSAIVAYYAILSLPALVVIILNIVGHIWGREIVQGELIDEVSSALGSQTAESIREMMIDRGDEETSIFTTLVGILTLIYGATGVFFQLQATLDRIWNVDGATNEGILFILKSRAKGFGFILILGFLLLISFIITSLLSAFSKRISNYVPEALVDSLFIIDFITSLVFIYVLFAALFKYLPSISIPWKAVRVGAAITALLFVLGKFVLAYYFQTMEPGSTYGAAGSIILIMLWVSYSSLILFFGATFTKVYADTYYKDEPRPLRPFGFKKDRGFIQNN